MNQLAVSLALILNMMDPPEARERKITYNVCMILISFGFMGCCALEIWVDKKDLREHPIYELIGLLVLSVIYFTTIIDLLKKLKIFVLDETKAEAWYIRLQFLIFLVAYGTKIIALLYWWQNPPDKTANEEINDFLIKIDVMDLVWNMIPCSFLLWMQLRSFRKMSEEKEMLKIVQENPEATDDLATGGPTKLNSSTLRTPDDQESTNSPSKKLHFGSQSRRFSHMLTSPQRQESLMDMSVPGSTSSMRDYFGG